MTTGTGAAAAAGAAIDAKPVVWTGRKGGGKDAQEGEGRRRSRHTSRSTQHTASTLSS